MAEHLYLTGSKIRGPILVTTSDLRELDKLIEEEWKILEGVRQKEILEKAEKDFLEWKATYGTGKTDQQLAAHRAADIEYQTNYYSNRSERSIVIGFEDSGPQFRCTTFEEAIREADKRISRAFYLSAKCGVFEFSIALDGQDGDLEVSVTPRNRSESKALFSVLRGWQEKLQPSKFQRIWHAIGHNGYQVPIACFLLLSYFLIGSTTPTSSYKALARELLSSGGVTEANQSKALELLLAMNSGYSSPAQTSFQTKWILLPPIIIFSFVIIAWIHPRPLLGLGRGDLLIERWRKWMYFVGITAPLWILSPFADRIKAWVLNWLS